MKATFNDFLQQNPNCTKYKSNPDAISLFNFLNTDQHVLQMLDYADRGKPALAGCIEEMESFFDALPLPTMDMKDPFTRTVVGRMVKAILAPFGYRPTIQKSFPKGCCSRYFSTASCYAPGGPASLKVVKRIEPVFD